MTEQSARQPSSLLLATGQLADSDLHVLLQTDECFPTTLV